MMPARPLPLPALDYARAWAGLRSDPRVLLPERPSGQHPLVRGGLLHGTDIGELTREGLLLAHQTRQDGRQTFRALAGAERAACAGKAAERQPRPSDAGWNSWKRGQPRSAQAKARQAAAMNSYYHQRGLSDKPGAVYMREWRAKQRAEIGS